MRTLLFTALLAFASIAHAEDTLVFPAGWKEPSVAVSPTGGVFVVAAQDGAISVAAASSGSKFGEPVKVARVEKLMCGMRRGPRIAAGQKSVVVTAISAATGDLSSWRSTDHGATWSEPVRVNGAGKSAREGLDGLAASAKDEFAVVWLDDRAGKGKEVWVAVSKDGGATWSEKLVYASPDGTVCECCHPSAAFNAKGELAVMWRNWLGGERDMWMTTSKDLGGKWSQPQKLGEGSWKVKMCPMDGGAIAGGGEQWTAIFRRESDVFIANPGKVEKRLASGKQCWLAATKKDLHAVWLDGKQLCWGSSSSRAKFVSLSNDAVSPCLAGSVTGEGPIVAVWQTGAGVAVKTLASAK